MLVRPPVRLRRLATLVLVSGLACSGAQALTDEEIFREFPLFLTPAGAHAVAMGGAYVALVADATAVTTNPAALRAVQGPELFVDARSTDRDAATFESRLGSTEVDGSTGARDLPFLGLTSVQQDETRETPTFVGAAVPIPLGGGRRVVVAASRSFLASRETVLSGSEGVTEARFAFPSFPNTVEGGEVRAYSVRSIVDGAIDTEIESWDLGAGYDVHPDFSVGLTVSHRTLTIDAATATTVVDPLGLFLDPGNPRLPATPTSDVLATRIDDDDTDTSVTVGLHWHPDSLFPGARSPWSFGLVWRQGANFEIEESTTVNDVSGDPRVIDVAVPDRYSVGASWTDHDAWTVSIEIERIEWEDLLEGFEPGVNFLTSGRLADGAFATDADRDIRYTVDDATVPRAGVRWRRDLPGGDRELWIAVGGYHEPDARIRMERFNSVDPDVEAVYLEAFGKGEDRTHGTAGVGVRFGRSAVHVAGDVWDGGAEIVASYVFQTGR
jgi:hypothetical protein